jgi:hypothetical protein
MRFALSVQRGTFQNSTRRLVESDDSFRGSTVGLGAGATAASGAFHMLLGSTRKMATIPAHVAFPGLMENRISAPWRSVELG